MLAALTSMIAALALQGTAGELRPWPEYQVIMWMGDTAYAKPEKLPLFWQRMRELGITASMVHGEADAQPLLDARMPYYVENMVNRGLCLKWNSKVADWDAMVTAWKEKRDEAGLVREYCFDDPRWQGSAREQVQKLVTRHAPHAPLLYDIRDELSTTMSANPFDYDFGAQALQGFRTWLRTRYASLEALNAEWETSFATWDEVKPFTTDRIKARLPSGEREPLTRWNFAPWCDHRTYMDISLASTLDDLRRAARAIDGHTPVGIEGTQMPSAFGGYDLWRLSQVLDWAEPYDICGSRAILGSFMPGKLLLSTVGEQDARAARRRLWHLLLQGDGGCIVWWSEDCVDWKSEDYALTARARALAPVFAELRSPLARLFLRARREEDPIAIHYSQASIQVAWLLDSREDGSTWLRRFSSYEAEHSRHARVRMECLKRIQDAGYTPRFVSSAQIEAGGLKDVRELVLPCSYALSDVECAALRDFGKAGGGLEACEAAWTGRFDEHGRMRAAAAALGSERIGNTAEDWRKVLRARVQLEVELPAASEVLVQRYRLGATRLVALERNIGYQMGEDLRQRPVIARLEEPLSVDVRLAAKAHVYDLRNGAYLGWTDGLRLSLDPWQPTLLALTARELPAGDVIAQLHAAASEAK